MQRKECITAINEFAGESNGAIDYLFEAADANGDGIVVRSEVKEAFQSLSLLRSGKSRCTKSVDHSVQPARVFFPCTLVPRINVHVRLLIFEKNEALYALIKVLKILMATQKLKIGQNWLPCMIISPVRLLE